MEEKFRKINNVALVGGTHGNELTGVYLIKKWQKNLRLISRDTFKTFIFHSNPIATVLCKRYVERDLNRCFSPDDLQNKSLAYYEEKRAKEINNILGPRDNPKYDFILDLHTTTSNMGLTIIISNKNEFNLKMIRYLKQIEPDLNTLILSDSDAPKYSPVYLRTLSPKSAAIEVGPIAQGIIRADIIEKTERLVMHVLNYLDIL